MIRLRYSFKLAFTKLHSKRGMLAASIIVSGLLFAVLIAGIIIFSGAEKSAIAFVQKTNNNKYLVKVDPVIPNSVLSYDDPIPISEIHRIKALEKEYYSNLSAKYKSLGLTYNKTTEVSAFVPVSYMSASLPEEQRVRINFSSPVVAWDQTLKIQEYIKIAKNKLTDLKIIGNKYNASGYYTEASTGLMVIPNLMLIQNGKENFGDMEMKAGDASNYGYSTNAIHNGSYSFDDDLLLQRYLLPASGRDENKGIPVVVSAQEAVALFGKEKSIGKEPTDAKAKAAWLKEIQSKMNGYTYQVCYRNSTELAKITKAQRDYTDIINNKDNADYQKPSLIYSLPTTACGEVIVQSDTRTADEKKADAQLIENQKKLREYEEPAHAMLTFQIVGIFNAQHYLGNTSDVQSYLKSLLNVNNSNWGAIISKQLYEKLPSNIKFDSLLSTSSSSNSYVNLYNDLVEADITTHLLEFSTIDEARSFMNQETCPSEQNDCKKLFTSSAYGSNYLILDEIGKIFQKIMSCALPIVLGLAAIIIWFTMVRVMADNRKETAVYRAMGAKRRDIVAIYLIYNGIIATFIAVFASAIGVIAAYIVNIFYGPTLTDVALSSFGIINDSLKFNLFDISSPIFGLVVLSIFVISFIAIIQPLIRNVMRSPIDDIRNE